MSDNTNNALITGDLVNFGFMEGGGELGMLTRNFNWEETSLGHVTNWPQSLRTMVGVILNSQFPMFIFWGSDLICFYNDAYRPSLGDNGKHPGALGKPAKDIWTEIWDVIKPLIDKVLTGKGATWYEDQLIPIFRNGQMENVYWTFSYSSITDETGKPEGVLVTCMETTGKILNYNKLEESKNELAFAIEAAELGIWDYNPLTGRFTGNERLKNWFGLKPENEIELSLAIDIMAEGDRERVSMAIQKALEFSSGGTYDIEYTIINPNNGIERIVRAKGRAWFNDDNIAIRFNGTLQDVTEQVKGRKQIKESEERFQGAVKAMEGILWTNNPEGKMKGEQPGWSALTGQTYDEYQDHGWTKAVHPNDVQPTVDAWHEAVKNQQMFVFQHRIKLKSGSWAHFSIRAIPLFNTAGTIREWVGVHTNITKQKEAEEALKASESRFRQLSESNIIGIVFWDLNGALKDPNQALLDILEISLEDVKSGKANWSELTAPESFEIDKKYLETLFETREVQQWEKQFIRKSGKRVDVLVGAAVLEGSQNEGIGFILDISDRKEAQKILEQKNIQLIRINNELDNFIYTASHDLKSPVSNIEGLIYALKDNLKDEECKINDETRMLFDLIQTSIERFKDTIIDLTEISKLQNSEEAEFENINLAELVKDVLLGLNDQYISSKANIVTDFSEANTIFFYRKNLKSIVYNLLSNSIKYRDPEKSTAIKLETKQIDGFTVLTCMDNGLGISMKNQEKMFTMFKRFHNHVEGSGVGLYIVKKIMDNAGGKIEVESQEGTGTKLILHFKS